MKSIALIAKYFGKPNDYLRFWLYSASRNPTIDFLFLTDDPSLYASYSEYSNIKFIGITEDEFAKRALDACPGVKEIKMKGFGYHCNQFRPLFGVMFADYLKDYDYWGYVDTDVVFGDIRAFFPDELLEQYEKFLERGHFTIYRNNLETNKRYLLSTKYCRIDYKKICTTSLNYGFDEMHGINAVYKGEGVPYYSNFDILLDFDIYHDAFTPCQQENSFYGSFVWLEYVDSKLFAMDAVTGRKVEVLYAHFQKRKITLPIAFEGTHFYIVPNEVLNTGEHTEKEIADRALIRNGKLTIAFRKIKTKVKSIPRYFGLMVLFIK